MAEHDDGPGRIRADGIDLYTTTRWCPLQYEGTVDGHEAYFRSRGTRWTFTIARDGDDPALPEHPDGALFHVGDFYDDDERSGFGAGYMELDVAEKLILDGIVAFRVQQSEAR